MSQPIEDAWHDRAGECAQWAMSLANRVDVWGVYKRWRARGVEQHVATWPWPADRGRLILNTEVCRGHFACPGDGRTIGLHTTATDNTSRWFAIDVDRHENDSEGVDPESNFRAAMAWCRKLRPAGLEPLLEDSNGNGGFHIWVLLNRPAPTEDVFHFIDSLLDDFAALGLQSKPETFPKQARLSEGGFGNWLRLPGKHPKHDHYSRFWNEQVQAWCEGHAGIAMMLSATLNDASLIPEAPPITPQPNERPSASHRHIADRALGRGSIASLRPRDTRNGKGFGIEITVAISEQVEGHAWTKCEPLTVTGTFWLARKDGTVNDRAVAMFVESAGMDANTLRPTDEQAMRPVQAIIALDRTTGELNLAWLRPFHASIDPAESLSRYVAKLPTGLSAGQQRSHHAYVLACHVVHDLGLDDGVATQWLTYWNNQQATPLSHSKLISTIANAHTYGGRGRTQ